MKKIINIFLTLLILAGFASAVLAANEPYVIAFQGKILVGNPMVPATGPHSFRFTLWNDGSNPDNPDPGARVWDSGQVDNVDLNDAGVFNVMLGSGIGNPLTPDELDGQALWLQVEYEGSSPLDPRHAVTMVPNAVSAKNVRGGAVVLLPQSPPAARQGAMYFDKDSTRVAYHTGTKWAEIDPAYTEQDIKSDMHVKVAIKPGGTAAQTFFDYVGKNQDAIITNIRIAELHTTSSTPPNPPDNPDYYIIRLEAGTLKSVEFYAQGFKSPSNNHDAYQDSSVNFTLPIPLKVKKGETVSITINSYVRDPALTAPGGQALAVEVIYIELPL